MAETFMDALLENLPAPVTPDVWQGFIDAQNENAGVEEDSNG